MLFKKKILLTAYSLHGLIMKSVHAGLQDIPGLLRHYSGDNTLVDSTNSGNDLVVYDGTVVSGTAKYESVNGTPFSSSPRGVLTLDSSVENGYHLQASMDGLPVQDTPRTIMGWFRFDKVSVEDSNGMFGYGVYSSRQLFDFVAQKSGEVHLEIWGHFDDLTCNPIHSDYTTDFGVWKHYAMTYESPTLTGYVNGVQSSQGDIIGLLATGSGGEFIVGPRIEYHRTHTYYGAAAELAVFNRALTAAEIGTLATDTAGGGGDPHFFGFGGMFFTWQGHCDIILTKTPKIANMENNVEVHIRTRKVRRWSCIDAIALKVGKDVLEIGSEEGNLLQNGSEIESTKTDSLKVVKSSSALQAKVVLYEFIFDKDKRLEVKVNIRTKMIYIALGGNYPKDTVGILGSPHNPGLFARDGTDMSHMDVNKFVESWQVRHDDPQLFQENRKPQHPSKCLYEMKQINSGHDHHGSRRLRDVNTVTKREATLACTLHRPGPMKEYCVEDAMNTGDIDSAKDTFYG